MGRRSISTSMRFASTACCTGSTILGSRYSTWTRFVPMKRGVSKKHRGCFTKRTRRRHMYEKWIRKKLWPSFRKRFITIQAKRQHLANMNRLGMGAIVVGVSSITLFVKTYGFAQVHIFSTTEGWIAACGVVFGLAFVEASTVLRDEAECANRRR